VVVGASDEALEVLPSSLETSLWSLLRRSGDDAS